MKTLFISFLVLLCNPAISQVEHKISYLDQEPPGREAKLFAPGIISTDGFEHSAPAFSPDGKLVLWTVVNKSYRGSMMEMKLEKGKWIGPYRPSFADSTADDYYPSFSPDGKKLYFSSRRKAPRGYSETIDMRIWEVERNGDEWSQPVPVDTLISEGKEYAHSVSQNGNIYFSSAMGSNTSFDILKSQKENGRFITAFQLPYSINSTDYEDGPYIAPDESFLIFETQRADAINGSIDLYIAFRDANDRWSLPVNMGEKINSPAAERFARLSPDGKYLFFGSNRNQSSTNWGFDIYWIDASVIEELRNTETAKSKLDESLGLSLINAFSRNDASTAVSLLPTWLQLYPNSLDAAILYLSNLRKLNRYKDGIQVLSDLPSDWKTNAGIVMEKGFLEFGMKEVANAEQTLAPLLQPGDQQRERYKQVSIALLEMKLFDQSDLYFDKAIAIASNRFEYHRRARLYARVGEKDRAFSNLERAVELGATSKAEFESDKELESLKQDVRWKKFLQRLK